MTTTPGHHTASPAASGLPLRLDLFSSGNWWDVGVRDFGLMLGALTLGRLASHYDPPFTFTGRRSS